MTRANASEKLELIRLVEESPLPVKQTLTELNLARSTFYRWYQRYQAAGYDGLHNESCQPRRFWNRIPDSVREHVVEVALAQPGLSPRELAWHLTDTEGYFLSESSVYRILKAYDLVTSPAFILLSAHDKFPHPTRRVNELWQTDFTQFKVVGWGWYYLSTVIDDYSRYIIAFKLTTGMAATDVQDTLEQAIAKTGVTQVQVRHRPRLLSDNGPAFISQELATFLADKHIQHIHSQPYHPMTQGKIERYHRSLKNVICLDNYYFPWQLEQAIAEFVEYYNTARYHEALDNMTPADVFFGKAKSVRDQRAAIKLATLQLRRANHAALSSVV